MQKNTKNKIYHISFLTNCVLLIVAMLVSITMIKIPEAEAAETIAEFNGTIYAGDQTSNKVTLMINVYWGDEALESMLDTLKEYNVHTTFFVGGTWVNENPKLAKRIIDEGHEIGSHGTTHKDQGKLGYQENYKEIQTCHTIVQSTLNKEMNLFAPPSGSYNRDTIKAAKDLGYKTIMWTRDTIDWRDRETNIIYSRAVNNMQGGDLVLMHPTNQTAEALPKILDFMKKHGFDLVPVSENITNQNKNIENL